MCDRTVTSRDAIVTAALQRSWVKRRTGRGQLPSVSPNVRQVSLCVDRAAAGHAAPGHPLQAPCSARHHRPPRWANRCGMIRLGPDRSPAQGPRPASTNGRWHAGAARAAKNPESRPRFTAGGKGNIWGNTEPGRKRSGAPAKDAEMKCLPFAARRCVPPARRGSRAFGLPTVTGAARRRPRPPARPGPRTVDARPDSVRQYPSNETCLFYINIAARSGDGPAASCQRHPGPGDWPTASYHPGGPLRA